MPEPPYRYPHERTNERDLSGYAGPVDIWDIDKTYLLTEFERLRDLLKSAFEGPKDKVTRPGARALLRGLRWGRAPGAAPAPLYFVSASPPQLRPVLSKKMALDGLEVDGLSFKDHFALVLAGRIRELRRPAPYKLTALLEYRCEWPPEAVEYLYGDDSESDARVYSVYAEIRAGLLHGARLDQRLGSMRVRSEDRRAIVALADRANEVAPPPPGGSVQAIYIFRGTGGARRRPRPLEDLPRVTLVDDALDLARDLAERGRILPEVVEEVEAELQAAQAPLRDEEHERRPDRA